MTFSFLFNLSPSFWFVLSSLTWESKESKGEGDEKRVEAHLDLDLDLDLDLEPYLDLLQGLVV